VNQLFAPSIPLLLTEFSDVEELCASVRSWELDFRPLVVSKHCSAAFNIFQQCYGPLEIGHAKFSASIDQRGAPPSDCWTFVILEESMRQLWWRGHDVDSETMLIFPIGGEFNSFSGPDFEVYTISIHEERIACVCERFRLPLPPSRLRAETTHPPSALLLALRRRLRQLRKQPDHDVMQAMFLVEDLVLAWLGTFAEQSRLRPPMRTRDRAIRKCLEYIEQADWTQLSPGILCEIARVGERTLQYAFRERFGLTPAAFLKMRRLTEVRKRLMQTGRDHLMVGDVAASLGFWHVGQFAADYRRAFGETPSGTLSRSQND